MRPCPGGVGHQLNRRVHRHRHRGLEPSHHQPVELYDLQNDSNEFENLASKHEFAQVRRELDTTLHAWMRETAFSNSFRSNCGVTLGGLEEEGGAGERGL